MCCRLAALLLRLPLLLFVFLIKAAAASRNCKGSQVLPGACPLHHFTTVTSMTLKPTPHALISQL